MTKICRFSVWVFLLLLPCLLVGYFFARLAWFDPESVAPSVLDVPGNVATGERSGKWPAVRAAYLRRAPACEACGSTVDLNVHHVLSVKDRPDLELELGNLITLCRYHHFHLGHDADGPDGPAKPNWSTTNPRVRVDARNNKKRR